MAGFITPDSIELIKDRLSIVQVVSDYVPLTRKGSRLWGLCPFHNEKTPSFTVDEKKETFTCFGCHKHGSIFDFVMEIEKLSFPEAVEKLADRAGVELTHTIGDANKISEKKVIYEIYDRLANSFHYLLKEHTSAQKARDYLSSRNISNEMRDKFLLGYVPSDPKWLYDFLIKKGYSSEVLEKTGLFSQKYDKKYPLFKDRLIFPVRDRNGKVIAFSARALNPEDKAKYINSGESLIYSKRNNLYGAFESINELRTAEDKSVVVCEGNFDVIALKQSGYDIAVAPLGTAFTEEQVKIIKAYNPKKVVLLFDNDKAGIAASIKALSLLAIYDIQAEVLTLEGAKDPNEYMDIFGKEKLKEQESMAITGIKHLVNISNKLYAKEGSYGKPKMVKFLSSYINSISNEIFLNFAYREISEQLDINERSLRKEVIRLSKPLVQKNEDLQVRNTTFESTALSLLLVTVFNNREYFSFVDQRLEIQDLKTDTEHELYNVLKEAQQNGVLDSDDLVMDLFKDVGLKQYVALSFNDDDNHKNVENTINDRLRIVKIKRAKMERNRLQKYLKIKTSENVEKEEILRQLSEIDKEIQELKSNKDSV